MLIAIVEVMLIDLQKKFKFFLSSESNLVIISFIQSSLLYFYFIKVVRLTELLCEVHNEFILVKR